MKNSLLVLLFLLISSAVTAQWDFRVVNTTGNNLQNEPLLFPIAFDHASCRFDFTVFDNLNQAVNNSITHQSGCVNNHRLLLDNYWYEIPGNYTASLDEDQWSLSETVNFGACGTDSGLAILTGAPALDVNGVIFQIDTNSNVKYFSNQGSTYLQFTSANGDIICANGLFFNPDIIFANGFEL